MNLSHWPRNFCCLVFIVIAIKLQMSHLQEVEAVAAQLLRSSASKLVGNELVKSAAKNLVMTGTVMAVTAPEEQAGDVKVLGMRTGLDMAVDKGLDALSGVHPAVRATLPVVKRLAITGLHSGINDMLRDDSTNTLDPVSQGGDVNHLKGVELELPDNKSTSSAISGNMKNRNDFVTNQMKLKSTLKQASLNTNQYTLPVMKEEVEDDEAGEDNEDETVKAWKSALAKQAQAGLGPETMIISIKVQPKSLSLELLIVLTPLPFLICFLLSKTNLNSKITLIDQDSYQLIEKFCSFYSKCLNAR